MQICFYIYFQKNKESRFYMNISRQLDVKKKTIYLKKRAKNKMYEKLKSFLKELNVF